VKQPCSVPGELDASSSRAPLETSMGIDSQALTPPQWRRSAGAAEGIAARAPRFAPMLRAPRFVPRASRPVPRRHIEAVF
jgi:hypothetical protein